MNLSTISTASIATLKSFARANNLLPTGDLRLKSTWLEVVQTFLTAAQEIAQKAFTYDRAVQAANKLNVVIRRGAKFTLKAMWSVFLVSIALTCIALDFWQNRAETKAFVVQVMAHVKTKVQDRWAIWTEMGGAIVQIHITEPVNEMRDRLNTAKSALLN